jgi:hypothetical protein
VLPVFGGDAWAKIGLLDYSLTFCGETVTRVAADT